MPRNADAPMTLGEFARLVRSVNAFHRCLGAVPTGGRSDGLSDSALDAMIRRRKSGKNIMEMLQDFKQLIEQELISLNASDGRSALSHSELAEILWPEQLERENS